MAQCPLIPLGSHVIIRRSTAAEKSAGGIVLPENAKDKPKQGSILAVGPGKVCDDGKRAKMQVKVGDVVLFSSYAGTEIKEKGEEFLIMEESEVFAIVG
jgi:chaperonin GroES